MPNALPRTTLTLLLVAGACAALPLSIMAQQQPSSAISVSQTGAPKMPSVEEAKQTLLPELEKSSRAVAVATVKPVKLPAGPAIRISYGSNSDPNPVTNKAIRLENDRYYFWKDGKLVSVNFSAPAGADNADQWDMMATTFRWR